MGKNNSRGDISETRCHLEIRVFSAPERGALSLLYSLRFRQFCFASLYLRETLVD